MMRSAILSAPLSVLIVLGAAVALFEPEPLNLEAPDSPGTASPAPAPNEEVPESEEGLIESNLEETFEPPTAPEALDGLADEEQEQGS